jgi:hypothetical protein
MYPAAQSAELLSTRGVTYCLGNTEIRHQGMVLGEEYVVGFDVAVDYTLLVIFG